MFLFCCRRRHHKDKKKGGKCDDIQIPGQVATQMILNVENRCKTLIEEARQRHDDKLDEAEKAAELEIAEFKKKKVAQHAAMVAKHEQEDKEYQKLVDKETTAKLAQTNSRVSREKSKVIAMIVQKVCYIRPRPNRNLNFLRQNFSSHSLFSQHRSNVSVSTRSSTTSSTIRSRSRSTVRNARRHRG